MNSNYDFILPFFVAEDDLHPAMEEIHLGKEFVCATDRHMMICVPDNSLEHDYAPVSGFPNCEKVLSDALSRKDNVSRTLSVDDLINVLSRAKWRKVMQTEECYDCDGQGEIELEARGRTRRCECETCNGKGKIDVRIAEFSLLREEDYFIIKINEHRFKASCLHTLAISAKVIGVDKIEYISSSDPGSICVFGVGNATILIMPLLENKENASLNPTSF